MNFRILLSVCYLTPGVVLFDAEAAWCRNCKKGAAFVSFLASENSPVILKMSTVGLFHMRFFLTCTLVFVTFTTWTVCTRKKCHENIPCVTEASEQISSEDSNKLYLSSYS